MSAIDMMINTFLKAVDLPKLIPKLLEDPRIADGLANVRQIAADHKAMKETLARIERRLDADSVSRETLPARANGAVHEDLRHD